MKLTASPLLGMPGSRGLPRNHYAPAVTDSGYMAICGKCAGRFNDEPKMIGRPRELSLEVCQKCKGKPQTLFEKNHGGLA